METAFRKQRNQRSLLSLSAVFFDLDNTLVETRKADNQTCRKVREATPLTLKILPLPPPLPPSRVSLSAIFPPNRIKSLNLICCCERSRERVLFARIRALLHASRTISLPRRLFTYLPTYVCIRIVTRRKNRSR